MPFDALPADQVDSLSLHKQVIARAYQLIEDPAHWSRGQYIRYSRDGVRLCAIAAIEVAASEIAPNNRVLAYEQSRGQIIGGRWLHWINDFIGHAAVLALFKKALAA